MDANTVSVIIAGLVATGAFVVFCAKGIWFFSNLNSAVTTLTKAVVDVRDDVKEARVEATQAAAELHECLAEHDRRIGEHAVLLGQVAFVLDLDDNAQLVVRESIAARARGERRAGLRRERDRVNEQVRDIMDHDRAKEG